MTVQGLMRKVEDLFVQKAVEECEEHLQQLLVLGESQLLLEEVEQDSPEALLQAVLTWSVIYAHYLSGLLRRAEASPGCFDWGLAVKCVGWLRRPEQTQHAAALLWEMEPDTVANLPIAARVLKLHEGDGVARCALEAVKADPGSPFWDFSKTVHVIRQALARGSGGDGLEKSLPPMSLRMCRTFMAKDLECCRRLLDDVLVLEDALLGHKPEQDSPEAALQIDVTPVILLAHYLCGLIQEVEAFPSTFDWNMARRRLDELQIGRGDPTRVLAALVWERIPDQAAKLPRVAQVLNLHEGEAEAWYALETLYSDPCSSFRNFSKVAALIRQALAKGDSGACFQRVLPRVLGKSSFFVMIQVTIDDYEQSLPQLLVLGESLLVCEPDQDLPEAPLQVTATRAVLFARYLSTCETAGLSRQRYVQWLLKRGDVELTKVLAALVWERMPDQAASLPIAARVLKLHEGNVEAQQVLDALYSDAGSPFWDISKVVAIIRRGLEGGDSGACFRRLLPQIMREAGVMLHKIFLDGVWECENFCERPEKYFEVWHELLVLVTPLSLPADGPDQGTEEPLLQVTATTAILFCHYLLVDVLRWEAAPSTVDFDRKLAYERISWLADRSEAEQSNRLAEDLAAMAWDMMPNAEGSGAAVAARILRLDEGHGKAHRILAALHSQEPFKDLDKAAIHLQLADPEGGLVDATNSAGLHSSEDVGKASHHLGVAKSQELPRGHDEAPPIFDPPDLELTHLSESQQIAQHLLEPRPEGQDAQRFEQRPDLPPEGLETLDGQDWDLQIALAESTQEHLDPLEAVRNNPILMHRQALLLPDAEQEVVHEGIFLLQFQRSSQESKKRLHSGDLLQPCRRALEEAGYPWLLHERGVKVFVHPFQYNLALQQLQRAPRSLFPRHVVATKSFVSVVLEALKGCPAGAGTLKSQELLGEVPAVPVEPKSQATLQSSSDAGLAHRGKSADARPSKVPFRPDGMPRAWREDAQQLGVEGLFLLRFQRNSRDFQMRLHFDSRLQPCRQALEAAGCRWLLEDEELDLGRFGVKVFVHPTQYCRALQLLRQHQAIRLFPNHVLVSESFLKLVFDALKGCSGGGGTLKPQSGCLRIGVVPVPVDLSLEDVGVGTRRTFLNTKRHLHSHHVIKSSGTASNPRQRKPDFKALSLSDSIQVSDVSDETRRDETLGMNQHADGDGMSNLTSGAQSRDDHHHENPQGSSNGFGPVGPPASGRSSSIGRAAPVVAPSPTAAPGASMG